MTNDDNQSSDSLLATLAKITGQVTGGTASIAKATTAMSSVLSSMFGEGWLRNNLLNFMSPERLDAMADAGRFLRDARETAGLSIQELSESLGMADKEELESIESGKTIMSLEMMLRTMSLLARHDPVPFLLKFIRTYNPAMKLLDEKGLLGLPKNFERERRFLNIYRQQDILRNMSDEDHNRFIHYINSSTKLVLDIMENEKNANKLPLALPSGNNTQGTAD